ncbi:AT-rich interactive domain-containing protein 3B-like isoform X2 [Polyodon spathula]|uniref:AT-rich interactive domain-containing protein 3B-like isoform X2 n=1 Tax=Polyodon spathula TaxID=7913 RepID=UPI001B7EF935|nr:AT-rich interactive domain-containing protein 3B-like isoform X2 [Polyodon spathula]
MVENSANSKGQMPGLTPEGLSMVLPGSPSFSPHHAGVKLEAVMEQLQRQQQARLEMEHQERNERHVREAHIRYAQQVAAQQAVQAAVRASGNQLPSGLLHRGLSALVVGGQRSSDQSSVDEEVDEERGLESGDDEEELEQDEELAEVSEEEEEEEEEVEEEEEGSGGGAVALEYLRKQTLALQTVHRLLPPTHPSPPGPPPPVVEVKQELGEESHTPGEQTSGSPSGQPDWSYDEQLKQNGSLAWSDEADGGRGGGGEASRDFAKVRWDSSVLDKKSNDFDREGQKMLYELDGDPKRKEFLDDLFTFMQKRGTPVNRIPIMAKQVLDLYTLYKLVTEKGGLVEVINKKIWREITKGLSLPTSITSAAFTLRTQYMKYLYPYECEKKGLSSPVELQAAIDSNRREGRRPSYTSTLFGYSPTPSGTPHILSSPKMHLPTVGANNGLHLSPGQPIKKDGMSAVLLSSRLPMAMALGHQQMAGLARAATLEQLREKLETGEPPERKMARVAEEQQRLIQHAFQQNLLAMATQMPMNIRINNREDSSKQGMALSISASGTHSISMSVEVNGTVFSGVLFAQKPAAAAAPGPSGGFGILSSSHSPTSSKAPSSAELSTSGSP